MGLRGVLGWLSCRGDGGVPVVVVEVAGAVGVDPGCGPSQGQVAVGEPVAAVALGDVPEPGGAGLVDQGGLVCGAGGPGPGAVGVGDPGRGDAGPVVGVAADGKAGGGGGQDGNQFPSPAGVDDGIRAGGDLLAVAA